MRSLEARRSAFRAMHAEGCFVLPNPWDVGGARRLETLGFRALASTSAGLAWSLGLENGELTLGIVLDHLRTLSAATDLPVNADFESGFADTPDGVANNVALALDAGVSGLSIEDRNGTALYDVPIAVERIRAARQAIDAVDPQTILVGRSEGFLIGRTDLSATIERLVAYADAGADCLYAPAAFSSDRDELDGIRQIVRAVAPKPVNVLLTSPTLRVQDLAEAGVRRVSVGSRLAFATWGAFDAAARLLREEGCLPQASFATT